MADFTSSVDIIFGVIDNASVGIKDISDSTEDFARNLEASTQPLADVTGSLLKFQAAVVLAAAAAIGFALGEAVKIESAFADLGKVAGLTADEVRTTFGPDINSAADKFGVSVEGVSDQLTQFIQAGFSAEKSTKLLDAALAAAVITELSAADAAQLFVQLIQGFGPANIDAANSLDTLNAISNTFATTAGDLGKGVALLGPTATLLGLNFTETAALLTPVLEVFQDGEGSARGLNVALLSLATGGTKEVRDELDRLGIALHDSNGNLRSGKLILADLAVEFQGLSKEAQLNTASIIGNSRQAGRLTVLLNAMGTEFNRTSELAGVLTDLTSDQIEALDGLGVSVLDSNGNLQSSEVIFKNLTGVMANQTDAQRLATAEVVVGAEKSQLLTNVLTGTSRAAQAYLVALNSSGSATAEFNARANTTEFLLRRLSTNFGILLDSVGNQLLAGFGDAADGLLALVKALQAALQTDDAKAAFQVLEDGFTKFGTLLEGVAAALPKALESVNFTPILEALESIAGEAVGLFDGLDITKPEDLTKVIDEVVLVFAGLISTTEGVAKALVPLAGAILQIVSEFGKLDSDTKLAIGAFLGLATAINIIAGVAVTVIAAISAIGPVFTTLGAIATGVFGAGGIFSTIGAAFGAVAAGGASVALAAAAAGVAVGVILEETTGVGSTINDFTGNLISSGDSLGTWVFELLHGEDALDKVSAATAKTTKAVDDSRAAATKAATEAIGLSNAQDKLAEANAKTKATFEATIKALESGEKSFRVLADGTIEDLDEAVRNLNDEFAITEVIARRAGESLAEYGKRLTDAGVSSADLTSETRKISDSQGKLIPIQTKLVDGVLEFSGNQAIAADATKKTSEELDKEAEAAGKLETKLEEIASNERIKLIEARIDLDIAQLEADTARLNQIFESIDNTVNSTGNVIGDVFGALGSVSGFYGLQQLEIIEKQLKIENERRGEALKLQAELTRAQISNVEAKTKALDNGDALISIQGDGLEPELEAFMFKILKKIQVKASAEGAQFLLGAAV